MRSIPLWRVGAIFALTALLPALGASADETKLDKEISFGVKMAQRGLWNEALFRFRRAAELRPGDGKILNNLAVAYEAVGQYDNALEAYKEALRAAPANRELKRNYSRFAEFYQSYKPVAEETAAEQTASEETSQEGEADSDPPSSQGGQ